MTNTDTRLIQLQIKIFKILVSPEGEGERGWSLALLVGLCVLFVAGQIQFLDDPYHWDSLYYVTASARDIYLNPGTLIPQGPWDNGHPPLILPDSTASGRVLPIDFMKRRRRRGYSRDGERTQDLSTGCLGLPAGLGPVRNREWGEWR